MRSWEYYAAVYGIIENDAWEILLMKRANTGYMDGKYWLPAWHLEGEESLKQWVIREIKEEICIDVTESDLEMIHQSHRITSWERVYFDFYFRVKNYSGGLKNWEPEKCSWIKFVDPQNKEIVPYLRDVFSHINQWNRFSEIIIN